jgi:hypothetical protein
VTDAQRAARSPTQANWLAVLALAATAGLLAAGAVIGDGGSQSARRWPIAAAAIGAIIGAAVGILLVAAVRAVTPAGLRYLAGTVGVTGLVACSTALGAISAISTTTVDRSAVAVSGGTSSADPTVEGAGRGGGVLPGSAEDRPRHREAGDLFEISVLLIALAGLGGAAVLFARRSELRAASRSAVYLGSTLRLSPEPDGTVPSDADLAAAFERALAALTADGDPRTRIRVAYARLQYELAAIGLGHRPSETPGAYIRRCISTRRVPDGPVASLLELFEVARFSLRHVTIDDARRAEAALSAIATALGRVGV